MPTICAARSTVGLTSVATSSRHPVHRASVTARSRAWIPALSMKASVAAEEAGVSASVAQQAKSEVPVALAGLQGRWSVTSRLYAEASAATLPRVTIGDYSGNALTAAARLEYRAARWLGVGAAYHYFRLAVDVAQPSLRGALDMTIRGPEAYLRFGW